VSGIPPIMLGALGFGLAGEIVPCANTGEAAAVDPMPARSIEPSVA
jgi:hypothetical protein